MSCLEQLNDSAGSAKNKTAKVNMAVQKDLGRALPLTAGLQSQRVSHVWGKIWHVTYKHLKFPLKIDVDLSKCNLCAAALLFF